MVYVGPKSVSGEVLTMDKSGFTVGATSVKKTIERR
jgi:hypothetical protein